MNIFWFRSYTYLPYCKSAKRSRHYWSSKIMLEIQ